MGIAAVIVKVMPESPGVDLEKVKKGVTEELEAQGAKNISFEVKEVAFGLRALMIKMAWPEEKDTDKIVEVVKKVSGVSEADIEDYRRAFG